ncbi:MAG: Phytoene desaturase (lycopene-forming) [Syntrophorhabdus sp. PtaU1.Bin153]|nr:MAG: Phytoene desaturase (lycopene-forming) [Syntrophorhabdus sp. PtaU1.Bin153]
MEHYDVIVTGAGINGCFCGALLAKSGLKVLLVERNRYIGGDCATQEITLPGFRHEMGGVIHLWALINPAMKVLRPELEQKFGLKYIPIKDALIAMPFTDGKYIIVYKDIDRMVEHLATYSRKDAKRYREVVDFWLNLRDGFFGNFFSAPQPPSLTLAGLEKTEAGLEWIRNQNLSVKDFVLENFEDPHVRTMMLDWSLCPMERPQQDGKAAWFFVSIPLIHTYEVGIPQRGSGSLTEGLARMIEAYGGKVLTASPVKKYIIEGGEARGIVLADGTQFSAGKAIVTTIDLRNTFLKLMDEGHLPEKFVKGVKNFKADKVAFFSTHLALNEPPRFKLGDEFNSIGYWRMADSVEAIDEEYAEIQIGRPPKNPGVSASCWSMWDPTRAPAGKHVLCMNTMAPYNLTDGNNWDDFKEEYYNRQLEMIRKYTTNMTDDNILAQTTFSPIDHERNNCSNMEGGIQGGELDLSQTGYLRPFPGWSQYRTPIKNLWMAGSYCHPGGGMHGASGTIAAGLIAKELGLKK